MASLSFEEFNLLTTIEGGGALPANEINIMESLRQQGLINSSGLTEAGRAALEPYRVRRAIVLAAGRGERMLPETRAVPKPMIDVEGAPLIRFALDALARVGIREIHVVRGYHAEALDSLLDRYPNLDFIENDRFGETNNITSLMAARQFLSGSYVMDADLVIRRPEIIKRYQYRSNYLAIPVDRPRGWCFSTTEDGLITGAGPHVTEHPYQIVGVSYWTPESGSRLAEDLPRVLAMPDGEQRYWDTVAIQYFPERYRVYVRPCWANDVVELDTYEELTRFRAELATKETTLVA